jgi:hypothetical protein
MVGIDDVVDIEGRRKAERMRDYVCAVSGGSWLVHDVPSTRSLRSVSCLGCLSMCFTC